MQKDMILFGNAVIIRILDKHKNWKAKVSLVTMRREEIIFLDHHKNLEELWGLES